MHVFATYFICKLLGFVTFCNKVETDIRVLFYFELGGITKHLLTGPSGNSEFCFPSTLDVFLGFASGNIGGLEETKLTVSLGASH